jgi:hypothetical protein
MNVLNAWSVSPAKDARQIATADTVMTMPTLDGSRSPKYCLFQAVKPQDSTYASTIVGDYVTIEIRQVTGNGDADTGMALVVGNPPIVVQTLGAGFVGIGWPSNTTATGVEVRVTPLSNY